MGKYVFGFDRIWNKWTREKYWRNAKLRGVRDAVETAVAEGPAPKAPESVEVGLGSTSTVQNVQNTHTSQPVQASQSAYTAQPARLSENVTLSVPASVSDLPRGEEAISAADELMQSRYGKHTKMEGLADKKYIFERNRRKRSLRRGPGREFRSLKMTKSNPGITGAVQRRRSIS